MIIIIIIIIIYWVILISLVVIGLVVLPKPTRITTQKCVSLYYSKCHALSWTFKEHKFTIHTTNVLDLSMICCTHGGEYFLLNFVPLNLNVVTFAVSNFVSSCTYLLSLCSDFNTPRSSLGFPSLSMHLQISSTIRVLSSVD